MATFSRLSVTATVTATVVAVGLTTVLGGVAAAATGHGYDVSWPQCGAPPPVDGDFRVVGVSGGKPYDDNPCLAAQYQWAIGSGSPGFYMNTANPGGATTAIDWYGQRAPNASCSRADEAACAYDYGYNAAQHAFAYAQAQTGAAARWSWWLDVETANSWSSNTSVNVADILGSLAYLRGVGVPVGAYSTGYQWGRITNRAVFADVYNWVAGASNAGQAAAWCGTDSSFSGGPVVLVQWVQDNLDHDHACMALPIVTDPPPTAAPPAGLNDVLGDLLGLNVPKLLKDLHLSA